ncbi:MAG: GGDEF domain-containing protein [Herbinix sp.]|nr:GGDEF domain-containing protein [Herbinix sp.]
MKNTYNIKTNYLLQDIGMFALLVVLFAGIIVVVLAPQEMKLEFILMLLISYLAMLFAAYRMSVTAVISAGLQIIIYVVYKLFIYYSKGELLTPLHFTWIIYPLLAVGAMSLLISRTTRLEVQNEILREQIDKLVLIDPLTGLYNLKSLYLDLQGQIALAARRDFNITLMIISLRYEAELFKILGRSNFDTLKQKIAINVQDSLRIEDRVYAIDEKGALAIILSCKGEDAITIKNRILKKLSAEDAMPELIKNKVIKLDFQFGYLPYSPEIYGKDVIGYKQKVESELQYDV